MKPIRCLALGAIYRFGFVIGSRSRGRVGETRSGEGLARQYSILFLLIDCGQLYFSCEMFRCQMC